MSCIKDSFDAVRGMVLASQTTYSNVAVGGLPADDSICMQVSSGYETQATIGGGGSSIRVVCTVNCKNASQSTAFETLCLVHEALCKTRTYSFGTGWQVSRMKSVALPSYAGMDGDQYLYVSSLEYQLEVD